MDWSRALDDSHDNLKKSLPRWGMPQANFVMDVHGDPVHAKLIIFSDGNHHMALQRAVAAFKKQAGSPEKICFLTTPPGPLVRMIQGETLILGNLHLQLCPHIFISPPHVLDRIKAMEMMADHLPFCQNRGSVLLVKKGNPSDVRTAADLTKPGFRLFLSSPETEADSRKSYEKTLTALSGDPQFMYHLDIVSGRAIHHREALEALDSGKADGAMLFFHLARHYAALFPDRFEMVPLGRAGDSESPPAGCPVNTTHAGLVGDGGAFGRAFMTFLFSPEVRAIYRDCGLVPIALP